MVATITVVNSNRSVLERRSAMTKKIILALPAPTVALNVIDALQHGAQQQLVDSRGRGTDVDRRPVVAVPGLLTKSDTEIPRVRRCASTAAQ
jgi:hypothetical protein